MPFVDSPVVQERSLYEEVGGSGFFRDLVDRFYDGVEADPVLRAVYPEEDLAFAREKLALFLAEYWGGPADYNALRGHPALRMRHAPFGIGPLERDRWLHHMRAAIEAMAPPPSVAAALTDYFEMAAPALQNR